MGEGGRGRNKEDVIMETCAIGEVWERVFEREGEGGIGVGGCFLTGTYLVIPSVEKVVGEFRQNGSGERNGLGETDEEQ
eukprot:scaffold4330_cov38-Attheya_sp.AAC.6